MSHSASSESEASDWSWDASRLWKRRTARMPRLGQRPTGNNGKWSGRWESNPNGRSLKAYALPRFAMRRRLRETSRVLSRAYSASTNLIPASTSRNDSAGRRPTFSVSRCLSSVISCDTLTTDSCGKPLARRVTRTLPGASANRMFDVIAAQIDVRIALSLNSFDCTISTGPWYPGPVP